MKLTHCNYTILAGTSSVNQSPGTSSSVSAARAAAQHKILSTLDLEPQITLLVGLTLKKMRLGVCLVRLGRQKSERHQVYQDGAMANTPAAIHHTRVPCLNKSA